jgi:predicted GNAT family N-acyltransferase
MNAPHNSTLQCIQTDSPYYPQVYQLRETILRKPLGLSLKNEDLSQDEKDIICIALCNENVMACLMLQELSPTLMKLRQMAVAQEMQGKGIGNMLVQFAETHCLNRGIDKMVLHARTHAIPFYLSLAYTIVGPEFTEVNIPHVKMEKKLR